VAVAGGGRPAELARRGEPLIALPAPSRPLRAVVALASQLSMLPDASPLLHHHPIQHAEMRMHVCVQCRKNKTYDMQEVDGSVTDHKDLKI